MKYTKDILSERRVICRVLPKKWFLYKNPPQGFRGGFLSVLVLNLLTLNQRVACEDRGCFLLSMAIQPFDDVVSFYSSRDSNIKCYKIFHCPTSLLLLYRVVQR